MNIKTNGSFLKLGQTGHLGLHLLKVHLVSNHDAAPLLSLSLFLLVHVN